VKVTANCTIRSPAPSGLSPALAPSVLKKTMHLLSIVRMGVRLGLVSNLDIGVINELFIHTQPAHLQKLQVEELEADRRNVARATTCGSSD
jgi:protein-arginine kinase